MCDFCGCPAIEPFATLTDQHVTLVVLAEVLVDGGGPADLDALRVSWEDHRAVEATLGPLAAHLDLEEVVEAARRGDRRLEALLDAPAPDPGDLLRAVRDHLDAWEFEVFPQLVLSADPEELAAAASEAAP
ncbi:MAG TPA: hypothetical protein VNO79_17805 [Actinomycetota bacterium]|nr:hypothetical protein [Actinomycetota bacterium]